MYEFAGVTSSWYARAGRSGRLRYPESPMPKPISRLSPETERQMAHRILAIEDELSNLLRSVPACRDILDARIGRVGRTRAAAVDRLEAAIQAATSAKGVDAETAATARERWAEAQDLRWKLALSATRVVYREA